MTLLHIDSSALGAQSASRALSAAIVARLRATEPGLARVYRDLDADPLPHLTAAALGGDPALAAQAATVLDEFPAADTVVIGAPMYNFGLPTTLRAWIDRILVAGRTFRYTPAGPEGLAGGKRVIVASSRGGAYGDGNPIDFQEPYLRHLFGFIGIDDLTIVRAEGLAGPAQAREAAMQAAFERIRGPALRAAA